MEADLHITENLIIPGAELWATASLSGGAGGQHVNKVSSRITLYWQVVASTALTESQRAQLMARLSSRISTDGVLQVSSDTHRSQHRNRALAREKMAALIAAALKTLPRRIPTRESRAVHRRRLDTKRRRGTVKQLRRPPDTGRE
ncbi:MAG: aminoacyl-tRNA hydrolase [Deltaproteobacteria bacterium]|nr:aminoacyl-tRNA hydrolase [Deltaproteobacteria bacterium]